MRASWFRLAATTAGLAAAGLLAATPATAGGRPAPGSDGPAGPPARLADGRIAQPPALRAPLAASNCPAAPYGPQYYAPGSGKTVALTFDDGPGASTAAIMKILRGSGITATFFNLGQNMAARPGTVRSEKSGGYRLGNHTWDHADLTTLSAAGQAAELDRQAAEQRALTGSAPCLFRPPYGSYTATTLRLAQQRRMTVWLWSVDTEDWKANGSASSYWVNRIIRLAEQEGGSQSHPVVLMHNQPRANPATVAALPKIIAFFRSHHYRFVAL